MVVRDRGRLGLVGRLPRHPGRDDRVDLRLRRSGVRAVRIAVVGPGDADHPDDEHEHRQHHRDEQALAELRSQLSGAEPGPPPLAPEQHRQQQRRRERDDDQWTQHSTPDFPSARKKPVTQRCVGRHRKNGVFRRDARRVNGVLRDLEIREPATNAGPRSRGTPMSSAPTDGPAPVIEVTNHPERLRYEITVDGEVAGISQYADTARRAHVRAHRDRRPLRGDGPRSRLIARRARRRPHAGHHDRGAQCPFVRAYVRTPSGGRRPARAGADGGRPPMTYAWWCGGRATPGGRRSGRWPRTATSSSSGAVVAEPGQGRPGRRRARRHRAARRAATDDAVGRARRRRRRGRLHRHRRHPARRRVRRPRARASRPGATSCRPPSTRCSTRASAPASSCSTSSSARARAATRRCSCRASTRAGRSTSCPRS